MNAPSAQVPVSIEACLAKCATNAEFVSQYNRITGSSFSPTVSRSALETMIDQAVGNPSGVTEAMQAEANDFFDFCYETVWLPLTKGLVT